MEGDRHAYLLLYDRQTFPSVVPGYTELMSRCNKAPILWPTPNKGASAGAMCAVLGLSRSSCKARTQQE